MSIFAELKRRNVFRVAAAYIIVAWLLMQVGDTLAPALLLPDWINSALAFFLILGFPLAIFFAWAFEMTPEGIKREKDIDRGDSITQMTGQKLNHLVIGLLVVAVGYFAFDKFVLDPGRDAAQIEAALETAGEVPVLEQGPPDLSIAVLPFVNMSADADNEYFSDGLTEELLNILAKIRDLQVAGRTSSFAFKGKQEDLREIGEKLHVKSILEGSVRKDDTRNRVRVTAQLINADDGYHLWSETYDRELDDIFAIQEEIAGEVARALRVTLLGEEDTQVTNTEFSAYDLYLRALQQINAGGYVQLNEAVKLLQQALTIDPAYLPARLSLVSAWNRLANTGAMAYSEAISRGRPMLETILAEDPDNSDAYVQLAALRILEEDRDGADRDFVTALEINPRNAMALQAYGRFLFDSHEVERGLALIDQALEIEPMATRILWNKCQANAHLQNFETSIAACMTIRELDPDSPLSYYGEALANVYVGNIPRTMQGYLAALERDPEDFEMIAALAIFWTWLGDAEQARAWLARADALGAGQTVPVAARMYLYQFLEQYDLAGNLAKRALDEGMQDRHGILNFLRHAWAFASVLNDDVDAALEPYRQAHPWVFEEPMEVPEDYVHVVDDLLVIADLLKRKDSFSVRADRLIQLAEEKVDEYLPSFGPWHTDGRWAAIETLRGNHDKAIDHLEAMFDMNFRPYWRTIVYNDPIMLRLRGEPGYKALIQRFEKDMERQREEAYELLGVER
jgi:TolB-like protein